MSSSINKPAGKNAQEMKKRNNEIINNLKQTLSKPTIVEAQRTLKIMEKLIERIAIFLNLDNEFIMKFSDQKKSKINKTLFQSISSEVRTALINQAKMEGEFRMYIMYDQQIKDNQLDQQKIRQYERAKKDIAYTFKTLIRAIQKHPQDLQIIKSLRMNSTPNSEVGNIHEALSNYKIIMQKTLATAAEQDESHTRLIIQLTTKIQSLQKTRSNCDRQLKKLQEDRKQHAEDKKQEMDKLKSQKKEVINNKEKQMARIIKQSEQQRNSLIKQFQKEDNNLKTLIAQEKTKLTRMRDENSKAEIKSKGDKMISEQQLSDVITAYDSEMVRLHTIRNNTQKQLKKLSDQLNNLKRHFQEIEEQRKREQALMQADRKRKHLWQLTEKKRGEAATKIKEAYRNWKAKNKKKKKKKK